MEVFQSKRKLEEEASPQMPPQKLQREYRMHDIHWAPDGNIVLDIRGVRFKVLRSRLASQSLWFKNLFDAQANGVPENPPNDFDTDEIQKTLAHSQFSDGLPLLFLDRDDDFPTHVEFAALLTAMDSGVAYMYEKPSFTVLKNIFRAAAFYRCDDYVENISRAIRDLFPDDPSAIGRQNGHFLLDALELSRSWPVDFRGLLPSVYYQLSRAPSARSNGAPGTGIEPLETLTKSELVLLLDVQKQLAKSWDIITTSTELTCGRGKCISQRTVIRAAVSQLRSLNLFDPIFGINSFLQNADETCEPLCHSCSRLLLDRLKVVRASIWEEVKTLTSQV
ncbi:hypothetical protein CPC08DRAFT_754649 [Agrocybe pediades]|nr:hypothetical protein CPC08DRAFT_754649 [Agrocybe pediades]